MPKVIKVEQNSIYRWIAVIVTICTILAIAISVVKQIIYVRSREFDAKIIKIIRVSQQLPFCNLFEYNYIIDKGIENNVAAGDLFEIIDRYETKGILNRKVVSVKFKGLLRVAKSGIHKSDCILQSLYIGTSKPREGDALRKIDKLESRHFQELQDIENILRQATDAYREENDPEIEREIEKFLERISDFILTHPNSRWIPGAMMNKAHGLYKLERYDEAMHLYRAIETRFPLYSGAWGARERINEIILQKRVKKDPTDIKAQSLLAEIAFQGSDYEESLERLAIVKKLDPNFPGLEDKIMITAANLRSLYLFLGKEALKNGKPEFAKNVFEKITLYIDDDKEVENLIKKANSIILLPHD